MFATCTVITGVITTKCTFFYDIIIINIVARAFTKVSCACARPRVATPLQAVQQPGHGSVITGCVPAHRHKQRLCAPPPRRLDASLLPLQLEALTAAQSGTRQPASPSTNDHNLRLKVRLNPFILIDSIACGLQHRLR